MAGSRKGEHRGGAKKKLGDPKPKRTARQTTVKLPTKFSEDYARQVLMVVQAPPPGGRVRTPPRELMWEVQEFFHDLALDFLAQVRFIRAQLPLVKTQLEMDALDVQLLWAEGRAQAMYAQALDAAFKAGPYYHSKMSPGTGEISQSPLELMAIIVREIDDATRGRPTWARPELKLVGSG
ncbi:MAG TPA: hypothetical protein VK577_03660 [Bradyrhizobium sp.]|nr:hypothetical protein [Bradyrhizobium sp.]